MKTIAKFDAKAFAAASLFQAKQDVRHYLNGVLVTPDPVCGVKMVATDGHRLVVVTDREGTCDKEMILAVDPASVAKMKQASFKTVEVQTQYNGTDDDVYCKVTGKDRNLKQIRHINYAEIIDGKFPQWNSIIKDVMPEESVPMAGYDGRLIKEFCDAAKLISGTRTYPLGFVHGKTEADHVSVLFCKALNPNLHMRGLLMPMRISEYEMTWLPKEDKS
jgi:hypothetical protein